MIELDVRTSKDGEMVLMHDATIERTTNGTGKVSELNYKELLSYNLYHDGALTEEKIPLFKDILLAARGKIYIDIDVKISDYKAVYNLVKRYGMLSQVLFTVYDVSTARKVINLDRNAILLPVIYENRRIWRITWQSANHFRWHSSIVQPFTEDILAKASRKRSLPVQEYLYKYEYHPYLGQLQTGKGISCQAGKYHTKTDYPVELKEYL